MTPVNSQDLVLYLITGLSGSGKSHALRSFEDMGFCCVDNLPFDLVEPFLNNCRETEDSRGHVAIAVDVRERNFVGKFPDLVGRIKSQGVDPTTLFFEAGQNELLNRYKESRRPHPLGDGRSLDKAIQQERSMLEPVRELADSVIDTSRINIHELRGILSDFHDPTPSSDLTLSLISFGFKHGVPPDLDMQFDARFLANPHYESELSSKTGLDKPVREFLNKDSTAGDFLSRLRETIELSIDAYKPEGKSILTIGIGCTGGRHRSVFLVDQLNNQFKNQEGCRTIVRHRDLDIDGDYEATIGQDPVSD